MAFHSRKIFSENPKADIDRYTPPKHPVSTALVLSLGIAGAALLILSYLALRRCVSRRRGSPLPMTYNNRVEFGDGLREPVIDHPIWYIRTTGIPQSVIESIHQLSYKKGEGLIGTSDCSVCLSEFVDGETLRLLPKCSHAFHVACIDTWLGSHTNCPLCRAPILAADGGQSSSSFIAEDGREGDGAIGINREQGSGEISNQAMIGGEMEPVRRSVSLDFSSAVNISVEANKAFSTKRSVSISGSSILL